MDGGSILTPQACCSLQTLSRLRLGPTGPSRLLYFRVYHSVTLSPANFNTVPFLFACRSLIKMQTAIRLSPGASRSAPFLPAQWWFPTDSPVWDLLLRQFLIRLRCALLVSCGTTFFIRMTCKTKLTVLETLSLLHPLSHLYQATCNPFKEWNEVCLTRLIQWFWRILVL